MKLRQTSATKTKQKWRIWRADNLKLNIKINKTQLSVHVRLVEVSRRTQFVVRSVIFVLVLVVTFTYILPIITEKLADRIYPLTAPESALLPSDDPVLKKDISYDAQTAAYQFQQSNSPSVSAPVNSEALGSGSTMMRASIPTNPDNGVSVTDPINNITFKMTPEFDLHTAKQQSSHVYYSFENGTGQLVYSPQAADMLEDLVLQSSPGNTTDYNYQLSLGNSMVAREESDGSINVYGSSISNFSGASADNSKDTKLLAAAELHAKKNKLLFTIPSPTVRETNRGTSVVHAFYSLLNEGKQGTILRLTATNLDKAHYPIDIDPTVTVQSAAQIFRDTNGESNVDFNASNGSISRGAVNGGVFSDSTGWTTNANNLNTARFLDSSVISNGYVYVAGGAGNNSSSNLNSIEYAQISTANNTIGTWSTTTTLPASLSQFHILTYNGYLYVLGGSTTSTGCASPTANVYYNPTQPNGALASSWTSTTSLPTALCSFGAAIYDNYIYVVGGQNTSGSGSGNSSTAYVYYAPINPNGSIGSWSSTTVGTYTTPALPQAVYDDDVQIYNNHIYVIGGMDSTTPLSTIYEAAISESGANIGDIYGSWTSLSNTFVSADEPTITTLTLSNLGGGSFSAVNDGYMYVSGGCTSVNTTDLYCNTTAGNVSGNTYVAQINADGTLGPWSLIASSNSDTEVGGSLEVFGSFLYDVAGCSVMNTTASINISCANSDTLNTQKYAQIQSAGQIGPVSNATSSGSVVTLPNGLYQNAAVVNDGYLYAIGGCLTASCDSGTADTSSAIYYAKISSNGSIGTWSTSSYTINGTGGLAAIDEAAAVYDGYVYVFGGYNYTGGTDFQTTSSASDVVWYAQFSTTSHDLTGNFTPYTTHTLAQGTYSMDAIADRGYVYAFGGCQATQHNAGCSTYYRTAYTLAVGTSGPGALTTTTNNLPTAQVAACTSIGTGANKLNTTADCYPGEAAMGIAMYNDYIYLIGGASGNNGQSVIIEYMDIATPGTLGSWTDATSYLPDSSAIGYYAALRRTMALAYNDYLYVVGGHDGDVNITSPNIDIGQINLTTGNITSESTSSQVLATKEWDGGVTFADGTAYVVGGCYAGNPPTTCTNGSTSNNDTQIFQIYNADNDGTASWNNASNTYSSSANSVGLSSVAYNGYIYTAGGCSSGFSLAAFPSCSTTVNSGSSTSNFYAPINPDGSIGTWTAGPTLAGGSAFGCLMEANSYLYYIGGQTTGSTNPALTTVSYSLIGANGVPGTWNTTTVLSAARTQMGCDSFSGTLYVVGGTAGGSTPTPQTTVYYAQPSASTGLISSWSSFSTGLTTGRAGVSVVAAGGYLYVFGGNTSSTFYNEVDFIPINPSTGNSNGSWATTSYFPTPTSFMGSAVANGYIFLYGGNTSTTVAAASCSSYTYIAPILSTGNLGPWSVGVNNFTTARMSMGSAYYNGNYYLSGGDNCGTETGNADIITTNVIQYGGEQSQVIGGFFTRYADLGGDAEPELFLAFVTNAQNDSVNVEYWQASYITSTYETNSWGASTAIPNVTSGTVTNVYAYNSSDTNVYLNRYLQLAFSMTQTKSFTFPDSTPPSVNSYYFYYSPAPQNRLRNGMDFQDEQQQGFDLNY